MKRKNSGFTIVELLTVVVIISILVGLLIPGIAMVRNMAKTTEQKAQFTAIELGIEAFKADYGQYPPSNRNGSSDEYQGAQKLAEAMVGRDMLGFHPNTDWGENGNDYEYYYRGLLSNFDPEDTIKKGPNDESDKENYEIRKDLYLELKSANIIRLGENSSSRKTGLFKTTDLGQLDDDSLVICDVYKHNRVTNYLPANKTKMTKYGNPILYYRADTASKDGGSSPNYDEKIYNVRDNEELVNKVTDVMIDTYDYDNDDTDPSFSNGGSNTIYRNFYDFISDPKLADDNNPAFRYWPHNSDSYILISAGHDGLYGTEDDICNFNK